MKKIFIILGILIVVVVGGLYGFRMYTKSFSPAAEAKFDKNDLKVDITYCRPSKKGRDVFGGLVPYGKVWRTGANEATEITFNKDVKFGGKEVKKGTYTLFTIPEKDKWTVILNTVLGQWGAFSYNQAKDALRVEVPASEASSETEMFTITLNEAEKGASLDMVWDKTKVSVTIE